LISKEVLKMKTGRRTNAKPDETVTFIFDSFIHLRRRPLLCPWMNAQKVDKSFMCSKLDASVDFATGG
jgi:hypothetical protein